MSDTPANSWLTIQTEPDSSFREETVKSPEEIIKDKKKEEISLKIINAYEKPDFAGILASERNAKVEDLDEDDIEYIEYQESSFKRKVEDTSKKIVESNISEDETDNYILLLLDSAKNLSVSQSYSEILDNMQLFAQTGQTLERAVLHNSFAIAWRKRFLENQPDQKKSYERVRDFKQVMQNLTKYTQMTNRPEPLPTDEELGLFKEFEEIHEFTNELPDQIGKIRKHTIVNNLEKLGVETHDPHNTNLLLNVFKNIYGKFDPETVGVFMEYAALYGADHGFSSEKLEGLLNGLLPAIQRRDPQVEILMYGGNNWGMGDGKYGAGDYICECFATKVTPEGLNKLILFGKELPTNNYNKFEQNRQDGLTLIPAFAGLRDFIHDEQPGIHTLISAMVNYYNDRDQKKFETSMKEILGNALNLKDLPHWADRLANLDFYEMEVEEKVNDVNKKVKAIEVLKRLEENTKPVSEEPPDVKDQSLLELMQILKAGGERPDKTSLNRTLQYVNDHLKTLINNQTVGLEPDMVEALMWIERKNYLVLKNMKYEEQLAAYKQDWFHSILRFQELTGSSEVFNEAAFERFLSQIDSLPVEEAYKLLASKVRDDIYLLGKRYQSMGKGYLSGAVWSGNTYHELIGLTDWKSASTVLGEENRKQRILPEYLRSHGD